MRGVCLGRSRGARKPGFSPAEMLGVGWESSDAPPVPERTAFLPLTRNNPAPDLLLLCDPIAEGITF